jgi:transposase
MVDECHLLWGDICGYGWGKTSERITIPIPSYRDRASYFGALDYSTREFLLQGCKTADTSSTIQFIDYLRQQRPGQRIVLIWDGAGYHHSKEMKAYLEKVNQGLTETEWAVTCIQFAPYAPEQNPVEDIWLQGKRLLRWFSHTLQTFRGVRNLFEWFLSHQCFDFPMLHEYWKYS